MKTWVSILETATRAPSPHNVQPWRLKLLSDTEAELLIEKRRTLPEEDLQGSFIILTMGIFIEALRLVAANHSFLLDYEIIREVSQYSAPAIEASTETLIPFARLRLRSSGESPSPCPDSLFFRRRTSRLHLTPESVPPADEAAFKSLADAWGENYAQVTDANLIEEILACNTEALFADLNSADYHDEIVSWFRFTARSSRRHRDGLDYRCMNNSRLSFWSAARLPQLLQFSLTKPLFKKIYRRQIGQVPTLGIISGPFWQPAAAFRSGRFLLNFWLECAARHLYIHPYGNLVTNERAARWCEKKLRLPDIWLIFKIGRSAEPPESYRRAIEEVLVQ